MGTRALFIGLLWSLCGVGQALALEPLPRHRSEGGALLDHHRRPPPPKAPSKKGGPVQVTGGFGKGVTFSTKDDSLEVNIRGRAQILGLLETKPEDKSGTRPPPEVDFMVRRLRLLLQGEAMKKELRYYIQFGFSNRDQESDLLIPLRDAYLQWQKLRDVNIRVGQMKVPFNRERVVSSSALQLVDRSNVNAELNLDRDVGLQLLSTDLFGMNGLLRYNLGVFGGDGRNRTAGRHGLLYVARLEVAPFGSFDDYVESDFDQSEKPRLAFGVSTAYNHNTIRARSTFGDTYKNGTVDYRHGAVDMMFKLSGFSLMSELLFRKSDAPVVSRTVDSAGKPVVENARDAIGFMAQAGQHVGGGWEVSLRYGEVRPMQGNTVRENQEIGGGVSHYFHRHDLKIQADYFRLRTDAGALGTTEEDRVRVQTQLFF